MASSALINFIKSSRIAKLLQPWTKDPPSVTMLTSLTNRTILIATFALLVSYISWSALANMHLIIFVCLLPLPGFRLQVTLEVLAWSYVILGAMKGFGEMIRWTSRLGWWGKMIVGAGVYVVVCTVVILRKGGRE